MSMTQKELDLLQQYHAMPQDERAAIRAGVDAVIERFEHLGFKTATDDKLARLEAAITLYLMESNYAGRA